MHTSIKLIALVAIIDPLLSSAAYLPKREATGVASFPLSNPSLATVGSDDPTAGFARPTAQSAPYAMPNATSSVHSSIGTFTRGQASSKPLHSTATNGRALNPTSTNHAVASGSSQSAPTGAVGGFDSLGLSGPLYNLNNKTCVQFAEIADPAAQWEAVDGDVVVQKLQDMLDNNKLVCDECFGKTKTDCHSGAAECKSGLRDLARPSNSNISRWDTAAGRLAQNAGLSDLQCRIQKGECSAAPSCQDCNNGQGVGTFAVLKSLETLSNSLNNVYDAIQEAGAHCTTQMTAFSSAFAPVPDMKDQAMFMGVLSAVVGGMMGFIPGAGGAVGGLLAGIGSSVGMDMFFFNQPGPADTSTVLGVIVNATAQKYVELTDSLFSNGSYSYQSTDGTKGAQITLQGLMRNGSLVQQDGDPKTWYTQLVTAYEKILFQQLAVFTWSHMQKDQLQHTPFITFAPGPCENINAQTPGFGTGDVLAGVPLVQSSITYNNTCWWLLDATPKEILDNQRSSGGGAAYTKTCLGSHALPGGTHDELNNNKGIFAELSLEDFIIPSVDGWAQHGKSNDYAPASKNGQVVKDPRSPGAVNIPVCDYLGNKDMPGVNCPKLKEAPSKDGGCNLILRNSVGNAAGQFAPGTCKVHIKQFQKNEGDENIFNDYQLEITVYDDAGRPVGDAAKELAKVPLAVDGSLPFQLIAGVGKADNDPIEFWYADDYWNSNDVSHQCHTGGYDGGLRQLDCSFPCPMETPSHGDTHSATIGHKLFAAPTEAVVGAATYSNIWETAAPAPTAPPQAPPPVPKNIASGTCHVHVRQHQKNEPDNATPNYELEVNVWGNDGQPVGQSGMVPAPGGKPVVVQGFPSPFTVMTQNVDRDAIKFSLAKLSWDTNTSSDRSKPLACSIGGYDSGARDLDCWFPCSPS